MAQAALIQEPLTERAARKPRRRLLVIDAAYTLETIRERRAERAILCRDLDGFFEHVWSVHPFATLLTSDSWGPRYGPPATHALSSRHTVIEGAVGRYALLRRVFPLNFLIGQLGVFLKLWTLVRSERITAIRVGDPLYLGLLGWSLARLTGAIFAIRVNGNYDRMRQSTGEPIYPRLLRSARLEKLVERFIFPRADLVFAPNDDNASYAIANGARPEITSVVNFGSLLGDEHFLEPSARPAADRDLAELGLERDRFLLSISRLIPLKFPDHVIRVLAEVRHLRPGLKALLVGDGSMRDRLVDLAHQLGVEGAVVFAGDRDQQFLSRIIPQAAVVLSPSTGRALSEAALGGAPIVAYDTDWQKDMIETDVTGILVPYRDCDGMAAGAARFLNEPAFARAMGDAVRRRALAMLDPAKGIELERESYGRLLEKQPSD